MIRNPHTLEDSWWDGPERFQWVNRNVISQVEHEELYKFVKMFAPNKIGLDIGGIVSNGVRSSWKGEGDPLSLKLNIGKDCDIQARAEFLPFRNKTIGYIISIHTFEHIKGDLKETLKEWFRVLVPGGLLGIAMPDKRFFLHNPEVTLEGLAAYRELEPKELLVLFSDLNVEILLFDSRQNNFDFDILVRKIGE